MMAAQDGRQAQFELERQLRQRILASSRQERLRTVAAAYAELFDRFPAHSVFQETDASRQAFGRRHAAMILPLTRPGDRVLEVGCGRGDVLVELARHGRRCAGIEPSEHMLSLCRQQDGIELRLGTAERLGFPNDSFELVFSMQVLEHLHPDGVPEHLAEAYRVLTPAGVLVIETPNRRTGPQDISRGFTPTAQGLHLKEWSVGELADEMHRAGFVRVRGLLAPPVLVRRWPSLHRPTRVPASVKRFQDALLALIPGMAVRMLAAKVLGLNDVFLFGQTRVE